MSLSNNAQANECKAVFYLQQISASLEQNIFKTPWGSVIVKNCDEDGKLLEFKSKTEYSSSLKSLWLNMPLKVFRADGDLFPVFCCPECLAMRDFMSLHIDCSPQQFLPMLCIHSRTVSFLVTDWAQIWDFDIADDDTAHNVLCNRDTVAINLNQKNNKNEGFFLAATLLENKIYILYTATKRQNIPICSGHTCHLSHCTHYRKYMDTIQEQDYVTDFDHRFLQTAHEDEHEEEDEQVLEGEVQEGAHGTSESEDESITENDEENLGTPKPDPHYLNELSEKEYTKMCGYNFSKIKYPFKESKLQQKLWMKRMKNEHDFPDIFIPAYSETKVCEHGHFYDSDDLNLKMESTNSLIFNEIGEDLLETKVMCRNTIGQCKCIQHFDGHEHFLWHLGKGKFVNYTLLINYLHLWVNDGTPKFALFKTIQDNAHSHGVTSTIQYNDLHRAIVGFFRQLDYDEKKAFSCPKHGNNPKWMNTDGKYLGPTKKKCTNLTEFDRAVNDDDVLEQSTKFKDRVFLSKSKERKEVVALLSGAYCTEKAEGFQENDCVQSPNGQLIKDLVDYIEQKYPGVLPTQFRRFIQNISKPTSVRGLIQVTNFLPLDILRSFCNEDLAVKAIENIEELRVLSEEVPVLWSILDDICNLEKCSFLPREVALIVVRLLDIRRNTFIQAKNRDDTFYQPYVGREHPTMCYPNNKLKEYPKKYKVNNRKDKDLCEKAFSGHKDFTSGIFSLGCACEYNITLGFELMLNNEGPKNLFRLLKCRDFDLDQVEGILMDHACIMDSYIMNREASILEWKRLLVDGAHWRSMKKFKSHNSKGKGGHIGCSEGFNWNLYKPAVQEKVNSQGREQLHALVTKCSESLRLMSYSNFMIFMKTFFAVTNLRNRKDK